MRLIADYGHGVQIWTDGTDFYVYGIMSDPRVVPSYGMACAAAAKAFDR